MAAKKLDVYEAPETVAAPITLHSLATTGADVAPITRGELRIILEDLLVQLGKADPAK